MLRFETQECDLWKNHLNPNRRGISEDCTFMYCTRRALSTDQTSGQTNDQNDQTRDDELNTNT